MSPTDETAPRPATIPGPVGQAEVADALASLIRELSVAQSLDDIMTVVTHGVRVLLQADGATFVLRDGDGCRYAEEDAISPLWKGRRFPMSACVSGWCMLNREAAAIPDVYKDPRIPADAYRPTFVRSLAMVPVGAEQPTAALGAYWSQQRQPDAQELHRLQAIADATALALAMVRQRPEAPPPTAPLEAEARNPIRVRSLRRLVSRISREGLRPDSPAAYAFAAGCVLAATLVRQAVMATGVEGLTKYSTYYPAVLLAMLVGGKRAGILAAALGGLAAYWFFMPPLYQFVPLTPADVLNLALYGGSSALIILIIDWYQRALLRLRLEDAKHLTLAREQRHRVKNALAVVEAVVKQSLRGEPERARIINQRIRSGLADVDLEDGAAQAPISLGELITAELQPYDLARFTLDGADESHLAGEERRVVALAVHELATNALKYGALSVPEGRVAVAWRVLGRTAMISWRESGGPPVQPPQTRGYGSILLRRMVEAAGGALTMEFPRTGLMAQISLPLERRR